jgi:hypothetical protein
MIGLLLQSKIARQVGAILVVILGIITFGQLQKRKGKKEQKHKQERATNRARKESHDARDEIDNDIGRSDLDDIHKRLRNKWKRN